jgi:hypothetical protein
MKLLYVSGGVIIKKHTERGTRWFTVTKGLY